jgi:drug/metabolite transporter (DMT)-like permease
LAGQLTIFETVFGVLFVYILQGHLPHLWEGIGIVVLLFAVIFGIRRFVLVPTMNQKLADDLE